MLFGVFAFFFLILRWGRKEHSPRYADAGKERWDGSGQGSLRKLGNTGPAGAAEWTRECSAMPLRAPGWASRKQGQWMGPRSTWSLQAATPHSQNCSSHHLSYLSKKQFLPLLDTWEQKNTKQNKRGITLPSLRSAQISPPLWGCLPWSPHSKLLQLSSFKSSSIQTSKSDATLGPWTEHKIRPSQPEPQW